MMPILASCVGNKALLGAGDLGRIGAGVDLPAQPSECARPVPHIALATGQEARAVLKRERAQLDVANARQRACYQFNEDIRTGYSR
jgi:hypothetical protein